MAACGPKRSLSATCATNRPASLIRAASGDQLRRPYSLALNSQILRFNCQSSTS
jgi:hypothetical protein